MGDITNHGTQAQSNGDACCIGDLDDTRGIELVTSATVLNTKACYQTDEGHLFEGLGS